MTTTHTRRLALSTAILAACAAGGALAEDPNGPTQCTSISNAAERLACFDRVTSRASASKASPSSPAAGPPAAAPVSAAPAAAPVSAAPAAAPVSAAPAAATPAPAGASTADDFGISKVQKERNGAASISSAKIKKSLTARVTGFREGPNRRPRVLLDNGQSWEYEEDGDNLLAVGDSVTIRRASLGSFLLVTPAKLSHRVRRIR